MIEWIVAVALQFLVVFVPAAVIGAIITFGKWRRRERWARQDVRVYYQKPHGPHLPLTERARRAREEQHAREE